jgi:outer membrane cobalamin receptor
MAFMITTPLSYCRIVLLFAFAMVLMQTTHAQNYRISGKVFDGETGEPLPGASVIVKSSEKGISTDIKGAFELKGITQDQITLTVSYVGYKRYTMDHDFSDDPRLQVNIQLEPSSENINEVTIEGQTTGQVEAMLEQKRAESIKNIISSEQVEQFPDMNAAEAMQRIPGITLQRDQGEGRYVQLRGTPPEYTSFQVNGEQIPSPEEGVRYVGMDIISADQIHKIEIAKVNTPDMDADAIGGVVNIVTKKANSQIPEIRASAAVGYNNLRQTNNSQLQFSYGQRYNGFGFYLNGSYFVNNYGSDNMEFEYMKSTFYGSQQEGINNYYMQYDEVQLRHYTISRERTGFSGTLDYKFNDNSFIYLRGMYNRFSDDELRRRKIYTLDDALSIRIICTEEWSMTLKTELRFKI